MDSPNTDSGLYLDPVLLKSCPLKCSTQRWISKIITLITFILKYNSWSLWLCCDTVNICRQFFWKTRFNDKKFTNMVRLFVFFQATEMVILYLQFKVNIFVTKLYLNWIAIYLHVKDMSFLYLYWKKSIPVCYSGKRRILVHVPEYTAFNLYQQEYAVRIHPISLWVVFTP